MKSLFICVCALFFASCSFNSEKAKNLGPLAEFKEFEIVLFLSPFENFDQKELYTFILQNFQEFGDVKVSAKSEQSHSLQTTPVLLFSLGGYQEKESGSIQVLGNVKVVGNNFQMACPIWKVDYRKDNLPYPVIENNKIVFKKDQENADNTKIPTVHLVVKQMLTKFAEEYRKDNPKENRPTFHIYPLSEKS